jgi:hypothetical protein
MTSTTTTTVFGGQTHDLSVTFKEDENLLIIFAHCVLFSDILLEDEPATIFINKYRKKSEDEELWV